VHEVGIWVAALDALALVMRCLGQIVIDMVKIHVLAPRLPMGDEVIRTKKECHACNESMRGFRGPTCVLELGGIVSAM
jgi:hypothetical protein